MSRRHWISLSVVPLSLCVTLSFAEAQGRGQGQGADKDKAKQGRVEQQARPAQEKRNERAEPRQNRDARRGAEASQRGANRGARAASSDAAGERDNRSRATGARGTGDNRAAPSRGRSATAPNPSDVARSRASDRARFVRVWSPSDVRPELRRFVLSRRPAESLTAGAIALANARDVADDALVIRPSRQLVRIQNRRGDVLVALDDDRARKLGAWDVRPLNDRVNSGAPSFCRSGEGHPVWGRQWCIDKGFGIGVHRGLRWARTAELRDVILRGDPTTQRLTRAALAGLLGDDVVDRLALHAVTMGLVDPLVGTWRTEATGPRVLLVNAGDYPVAEIVDVNRDRRGDVMLVALRPW